MRLTHRARTAASPEQVWQVLGVPGQWPRFDLTLRAVRGASGRALTGQRLVGLSRVGALGIPLDVLEATPPSRLVLVVHALPGLRQEVTTDVLPAARGGSEIRQSTSLDGPLLWPALWPAWWTAALQVRLLARRADAVAEAARPVA